MMRAAAIGLLLLAVVGCGDPETERKESRLNPGDRLVVVGSVDDEPLFKGDGNVKPGDIVECENDTQKMMGDPGTEGDPPAELAPTPYYREVRVVVIEGNSKGKIGTLYRRHLRPAPK